MSSIYKELPQLNFVDAGVAIAACIRGNRTPMLIGAPGVGKCLGAGTPVMLADGRVLPVEQVVVGDQLMGPDGKPRNVKSTNVGTGPLFQVTPVKGEPWVCNDVHVMTLVDTDSDEIIDIPLDKWFAQHKTFRERHKLFSVGVDTFAGSSSKPLPVDPYFLGVWFGDGSKGMRDGDPCNGLQRVRISKPDPEIRALCEDTARAWDLKVTEHRGLAACPTYSITAMTRADAATGANRLLIALRDLVGPAIAMPESYLKASREDRMRFLAGLIDSDGELAQGCFVITQKRQDYADAIWWLARSLGFCATRRPRTAGYVRADGSKFESTYYTVTISGETSEIPTRIPRKQAAPRKQRKVATRTGFSVAPLGEGVYYGFTLDGDGRFLLGDFTVTHNTALQAVIADAFDLPLVTAILSNCDPTDVAGLPMLNPKSGKVELHAFPELRHAQEEGVLLFLDEFTAIRRSVEAPALRLILERVAGGAPLHKNTRIVGACNPPEHAPGGIELSAAMLNRIIWLRYAPRYEEISNYFVARAKGTTPANLAALGKAIKQLMEVDYAQAFATEALDFAATMAVQPDLVQLEPPEAAINAGSAWGSPRAWEAGIAAYAALGRSAASGKSDAIGYAILAGAVGPHCAVSYLGIRDLRTELPTVADIVAQPDKAKVPTRKDLGIAAIGVIARVAQEDAGAAWIYMQRMQMLEVAAAGYRLVEKYASNLSKSKFGKEGVKAYSELSRRIGNSMG